MPSKLRLTKARIEAGEHALHVRMEFVNESGGELGPGGLRFVAVDKRDEEIKMSAAHLWPVAAGETVTIVSHLGNAMWDARTIRLKSLAYVELSGRVSPLASSVAIGMMQGTKIESES